MDKESQYKPLKLIQMPIKEENKKRYPKNWKQISERIRFERAGNKCEVCGIANGLVIKRTKDGYRLPCQTDWDMIHSRIKYSHSNMTESLKYHGFTKIVLTVAHLDHQPENCEDDNLKAMCQKCHNNYDRQHRNGTVRQSRLKNQMSMFYGIAGNVSHIPEGGDYKALNFNKQ